MQVFDLPKFPESIVKVIFLCFFMNSSDQYNPSFNCCKKIPKYTLIETLKVKPIAIIQWELLRKKEKNNEKKSHFHNCNFTDFIRLMLLKNFEKKLDLFILFCIEHKQSML